MRIATWNVNSVKARLQVVLDWLGEAKPDVALLQEIKCEADAFPHEVIGDLGYNMAVVGQRAYNGVAILSKRPLEDIQEGLPGDPEDEQARYVEATIDGVRIASLYLPNGNPVTDTGGGSSGKYAYKLAWMERLRDRAATLLAEDWTFVLGGDFNVIPDAADCYDPPGWAEDALYRLETRRRFRSLVHLGLVDAYRALHDGAGAYTFWDYQGGAWNKDNGIRIDHLLLSPKASDRLEACEIDRKPRGWAKASDHTPVVVTLEDRE